MKSINYFEIVRDLVTENVTLLAERDDITEDAVYAKIGNAARNNSQEWASGKRPQIPYEDSYCRLAYMYSIVPANANLIENVFVWDEELFAFFEETHKKKKKVSICAFGGGPGTEVLGLAKCLQQNKAYSDISPNFKLKFLLLDKTNEWLEMWQLIERELESRCSSVDVSGSCWNVDITDTSNFANVGNLFGQDLYMFSYVLSEIFDDEDLSALTDFIAIMSEKAPVGSKFLFIDRNEWRLKNRVETIAKEVDMNLTEFRLTKTNMSRDEQASTVASISQKLNLSPRLTWNAFWVVGTKV